MRALGVLRWNDILLGPEPPAPPKEKPVDTRDQAVIEAEETLARRRTHYETVLNRSVDDEELKRLP